MNTLRSARVNHHQVSTQQQSLNLKMFVGNDPATLEEDVNQWLATTHRRVHHAAQSQSERGGKFVLVISLYYEDC